MHVYCVSGQARETFQKYDLDKSGEVDTKELPALLRELNLRLTDTMFTEYCEKFMKQADVDRK